MESFGIFLPYHASKVQDLDILYEHQLEHFLKSPRHRNQTRYETKLFEMFDVLTPKELKLQFEKEVKNIKDLKNQLK